MVAGGVGQGVGQHGLGPHVIGQRVVVRRVVRGETGPSGGPALTDLLGTCVAWGDGVCVVQPAAGAPVTIPLGDIVSGKPVPPRPSVRDRVPARDAQVLGCALFADLETEPLGDWVLRRSPTATARRANSVLAFGPTGLADQESDDVAHEQVVAFYDNAGQRPIAAVLPDSAESSLFEQRGWVPESDDADTVFQVSAVATVARALRAAAPPDVDVLLDDLDPQAVASVLVDGTQVAAGVAAFDRDWVGFRSIEVSPEHRRRGLGLAVMGALLDWGAERGATTAYLQVLGDNDPALALYAQLGFREHHRYRYLTRP
ncbi:Acetyltransferase (GNAT) family protein [Nocardioides psychrotolerans]|uniref:Acetyltransferase (GNAT) family protein n=1 Tax=Nocardioides psychrotolerans TaxID=1005945 RepID=A0A1I3IVV3_9ACTN|nr:Acetyltransferase (GNAT) family protein [Nocardioides psychrotolerans]